MALFTKNLCTLDRVLRGIIGITVTTYGIFWGEQIGDPLLQGLVILFGALNLVSLATGWCAVYQIANIKSCKDSD